MALRKFERVGKADAHVLVEADREGLVVRVTGLGKGPAGRQHHLTVREHAGAVVDDEAHRDRDVGVIEEGDWLRNAVFEYLECTLRKIRHRIGFAVEHVHVQHHDVGPGAKHGLLRSKIAAAADNQQRNHCRTECDDPGHIGTWRGGSQDTPARQRRVGSFVTPDPSYQLRYSLYTAAKRRTPNAPASDSRPMSPASGSSLPVFGSRVRRGVVFALWPVVPTAPLLFDCWFSDAWFPRGSTPRFPVS